MRNVTPSEINTELETDPRISGPQQRELPPQAREDRIDVLDIALALARRKWFIVLSAFIAAIATAIFSLIATPVFTARTTILPPQQPTSAASLLSPLGGLASLGGAGGAAAMLGLKNPDDLYIGLFKSETVADAIIDRFHLMKIYKVKKKMDARNILAHQTTILAEKSSFISIAVKDSNAARAAAIANAYVAQLHDLMSHLAVTEAAQRRIFFEQQLDQEKTKLSDAESALAATERKTGIIQPQGQASAVIMTITQLRAQISASEVALGALRTSATDQNPEVITLQSQIAGLRAQLADFERGHPGAASAAGEVLTPTSQVPAASIEYIRAMRDVRYQETLFELLARQYEMAKVDEAKQGQMIQVVDPAHVPERRSWPHRSILTILAFIIGGLFAVIWTILAAAAHRKTQDPESRMKIAELREALSIRRPRDRTSG